MIYPVSAVLFGPGAMSLFHKGVQLSKSVLSWVPLAVQIFLNHVSFGSLVHLLYIFMFSGLTWIHEHLLDMLLQPSFLFLSVHAATLEGHLTGFHLWTLAWFTFSFSSFLRHARKPRHCISESNVQMLHELPSVVFSLGWTKWPRPLLTYLAF